jgi:hypothetical protein
MVGTGNEKKSSKKKTQLLVRFQLQRNQNKYIFYIIFNYKI